MSGRCTLCVKRKVRPRSVHDIVRGIVQYCNKIVVEQPFALCINCLTFCLLLDSSMATGMTFSTLNRWISHKHKVPLTCGLLRPLRPLPLGCVPSKDLWLLQLLQLFLQHILATHFCNTFLQHVLATHSCNTYLQLILANTFLQLLHKPLCNAADVYM